MLDRVVKIALLYDFYGALLTDKQQKCLELHYLSDYSLAEIATEFAVSRQAVHDILRRGEQILEDYERKLGLAERHRREQEIITQALAGLNDLPDSLRNHSQVTVTIKLLNQLIDQREESG